LSARRATSVPETTDWRKKLTASAPSDASLNRDPFGGRKRKLVQVAPATAANPTGRSAGDQPDIISQKTRKDAARTAAARARPGEALSAGVFNGPTQHPKPTRCVVAHRPAGTKSGHARCLSGSASEISIPALRRGAGLPCSTRQGKHRCALKGGAAADRCSGAEEKRFN
jgi:hypothetical protein